MALDQYTEIREYIIEQLNVNGFSNIVTEVNTRLEEDYENESFKKNPYSLLTFFLRESIDILENLSNQRFDELLSRFNNINDNQIIDTISVELMNQGELVFYDLKDLPDYKEITITFQEILKEIQNRN